MSEDHCTFYDEKVPVELSTIISKVTGSVNVNLIFMTNRGTPNPSKPWLIIVTGDLALRFRKKVWEDLRSIFQSYPGYIASYFTPTYIGQETTDGNTFFLNLCTRDNLVYCHKNYEFKRLFKNVDAPAKIDKADRYCKNEIKRILAFSKGAHGFLEDKDYGLAAFMIHQSLELGFTLLERFLVGKTLKGHSLREHQAFIGRVYNELGDIFPQETEEQIRLLNKLDRAYVKGRYSQDFKIKKGQILKMKRKADIFYQRLTTYIKNEIHHCQNVYGRAGIELKEKDVPENAKTMDTTGKTDLAKIRKLAREHYRTLEPYLPEKGLFGIPLATSGYEETSYMASHILKVCILALEASPDTTRRLIPEPSHNVRQVLGYALQLIPHDEMEFLDKTRDILGN